MSRISKICLFLAILLLIIVGVITAMGAPWMNLYSVMLYLAGALVVAALGFDYRLYVGFFTMRTARNGMSMGASILIALVVAVCVNYLGNLHNVSWDVTQERLNSLSDESRKVIDGLKEPVEIKVFVRENVSGALEQKQALRASLTLFTDYTNKIKVRFINPYVENSLAMEYLNKLPDRDAQAVFVFVETGGKKIRAERAVEDPESAITSALIKATHTAEPKVYFTRGHGEKDIDAENETGIKDLARSLAAASYKPEPLSLIDTKRVPEDAAVVAIIGPRAPFLDSELKWLREYAASGGKIFLALDPGQRANLAGFAKSLGVEFVNNFVLSAAQAAGAGPAMIVARGFDPNSEITRNMAETSSFGLFFLTSEVKTAPDKAAGITVTEIVKSDKDAFTVNDISTRLDKLPQTKAVSIATESEGKVDEAASKPFTAVIFGDSDFLDNQMLMINANRDLAMNAFAKLTEQKDLLSIRPKMPKGTMIFLTTINKWFVLLFGLGLPIVLFMISAVVWFRRRGA